jgi:hypothetical protein
MHPWPVPRFPSPTLLVGFYGDHKGRPTSRKRAFMGPGISFEGLRVETTPRGPSTTKRGLLLNLLGGDECLGEFPGDGGFCTLSCCDGKKNDEPWKRIVNTREKKRGSRRNVSGPRKKSTTESYGRGKGRASVGAKGGREGRETEGRTSYKCAVARPRISGTTSGVGYINCPGPPSPRNADSMSTALYAKAHAGMGPANNPRPARLGSSSNWLANRTHDAACSCCRVSATKLLRNDRLRVHAIRTHPSTKKKNVVRLRVSRSRPLRRRGHPPYEEGGNAIIGLELGR